VKVPNNPNIQRWPEKLIPVAPKDLQVDRSAIAPSAKVTDRELDQITKNISEIYSKLHHGHKPKDIRALSYSKDPNDREIAETYKILFDRSGRRISADYQDGKLVVQNGRHRTLHAQKAGAKALPVFVKAKSEKELQQIGNELSKRLEKEHGPSFSLAHEHINSEQSKRQERELKRKSTRNLSRT